MASFDFTESGDSTILSLIFGYVTIKKCKYVELSLELSPSFRGFTSFFS